MPVNERPGVYTSYTVQSTLAGSGAEPAVGVAAVAASGTAGKAVTLTSAAEAVSAFGADCAMTKLIRALLQNGASRIVAVPAVTSGTAQTSDYTAAFAQLMEAESVRFMVCDSRAAAVHAAMKSAITGASREKSKYRVGIVEGEGTAAELVSAAAAINCERMVLAAPGEDDGTAGLVSAALAGCCAAMADPALPVNGAELYGVGAMAAPWTDVQINTLVQGGVTAIESVSGQTSVVRAVTTRTTTEGTADPTWRELGTVLIVDTVIPAVRDRLRALFSRAKNTEQSRGAVRTAVVAALEEYMAAEIITDYGGVSAEADASDPTVCLVTFEFTVAHGISRISLVAHITV